MAKAAHKKDTPTVKAVLAYARQLRELAERHRITHPMEPGLYAPSNDAARKVSQQYGPESGLRELARRARVREMRVEEERARAKAARSAHRGHLLVAAGEREAERDELSLGVRLDRALLRLSRCSVTPASAPASTGTVTTGSRERSGPRRLDRDLPSLEAECRQLVVRMEREAEQAARRLVEEEAA